MGQDILLVAEHLRGTLAPSTFELIAKGRELAAQTGGAPRAALLGHNTDALAASLARYGLEVLHVNAPSLEHYTYDGYAHALRGLLGVVSPRVVLIGHTSQGYDLGPGFAATEDLPLVANCVDVRLDGSSLVATRRLLNEKVQGEFEVSSDRPFIVTMRPGAVPPAEPAGGGKIATPSVSMDSAKLRTRFLRLEEPEVQDIDLGSADVIVAAGRGIQKKENLALIEEFAASVGGVVGASRPLTDMEWLPKTRQVGQSGKTVRPKLYVACGISGAMQHVSGMKDSGLIIAVNTDPSAPIFEVAHFGFVANVLELLPAVLKELKR